VKGWIVTLVSLLALLAGLWYLTRDVEKPVPEPFVPTPPAGAAEMPRSVEPAARAAPKPVATVPTPAPPRLPPPQAPAQDLEREASTQALLAASLDAHKDLAVVRSLRCEPGGVCQVELAVSDLPAFMPIFARLGEPGGGLTDENTMMVLQASEPGPGKSGTLRFQLIREKGDAP
jgi:hypothetical protein